MDVPRVPGTNADPTRRTHAGWKGALSDSKEMTLEEASLNALMRIRRDVAWIAFVVVLSFLLAVVGVVVAIGSSSSNKTDLCQIDVRYC
jgi:hypothetical protein